MPTPLTVAVPGVAEGAGRKAGGVGGSRTKQSGSSFSASSPAGSASAASRRARNGDKVFGDEARLLTKLLRGYEKAVRPVANASHTINVKVNFALTQILDMVSSCWSDTHGYLII